MINYSLMKNLSLKKRMILLQLKASLIVSGDPGEQLNNQANLKRKLMVNRRITLQRVRKIVNNNKKPRELKVQRIIQREMFQRMISMRIRVVRYLWLLLIRIWGSREIKLRWERHLLLKFSNSSRFSTCQGNHKYNSNYSQHPFSHKT